MAAESEVALLSHGVADPRLSAARPGAHPLSPQGHLAVSRRPRALEECDLLYVAAVVLAFEWETPLPSEVALAAALVEFPCRRYRRPSLRVVMLVYAPPCSFSATLDRSCCANMLISRTDNLALIVFLLTLVRLLFPP